MSSLSELVREYLNSGKLMQLATASDGQPWLVHVWYASSEDLKSLVFTSNKIRRHSGEIRRNPRVAGGVVDIDLSGLGQKVRGLAFEGDCRETSGSDLQASYELYAARWPHVRNMFTAADVSNDLTGMRMYLIDVREYVLFDEVNFPDDPRKRLTVR